MGKLCPCCKLKSQQITPNLNKGLIKNKCDCKTFGRDRYEPEKQSYGLVETSENSPPGSPPFKTEIRVFPPEVKEHGRDGSVPWARTITTKPYNSTYQNDYSDPRTTKNDEILTRRDSKTPSNQTLEQLFPSTKKTMKKLPKLRPMDSSTKPFSTVVGREQSESMLAKKPATSLKSKSTQTMEYSFPDQKGITKAEDSKLRTGSSVALKDPTSKLKQGSKSALKLIFPEQKKSGSILFPPSDSKSFQNLEPLIPAVNMKRNPIQKSFKRSYAKRKSQLPINGELKTKPGNGVSKQNLSLGVKKSKNGVTKDKPMNDIANLGKPSELSSSKVGNGRKQSQLSPGQQSSGILKPLNSSKQNSGVTLLKQSKLSPSKQSSAVMVIQPSNITPLSSGVNIHKKSKTTPTVRRQSVDMKHRQPNQKFILHGKTKSRELIGSYTQLNEPLIEEPRPVLKAKPKSAPNKRQKSVDKKRKQVDKKQKPVDKKQKPDKNLVLPNGKTKELILNHVQLNDPDTQHKLKKSRKSGGGLVEQTTRSSQTLPVQISTGIRRKTNSLSTQTSVPNVPLVRSYKKRARAGQSSTWSQVVRPARRKQSKTRPRSAPLTRRRDFRFKPYHRQTLSSYQENIRFDKDSNESILLRNRSKKNKKRSIDWSRSYSIQVKEQQTEESPWIHKPCEFKPNILPKPSSQNVGDDLSVTHVLFKKTKKPCYCVCFC